MLGRASVLAERQYLLDKCTAGAQRCTWDTVNASVHAAACNMSKHAMHMLGQLVVA